MLPMSTTSSATLTCAGSSSAAASAVLIRRFAWCGMNAAKASDVAADAIRDFLDGQADRLTPADLRALAGALSFDHRVLLPAQPRRDSVGKTCQTVAGSRETIRPFQGYTVASVAAAPTLPDLTGMFMLIDGELT